MASEIQKISNTNGFKFSPPKTTHLRSQSGKFRLNPTTSSIMSGAIRPNSVDIDSFYEDDTSGDLMAKFTHDARRSTHKNSHRSRGRYGRGLAKKNGAGGHFTWTGSEFSEDQLESGIDPAWDNSDPFDPNYDSDSEENCKFESITPPLSNAEVEKFLQPLMLEYFEHGDTNEVLSSLKEVNMTSNHWQIPVASICLALEKKPSHCEMASILISDLFDRVLFLSDIEKAFDCILDQLDDLELDTPFATTIVGNFIARAIADDCLPPKYVTNGKELLESKGEEHLTPSETRALKALVYANSLINAKRGLIRLDTVWGLTGGARPVKYLIKQMRLLLKEYLSSLDVNEAEKCLRELEVPHFLHEFVYEAILIGIENTKNINELTAIAKLLKALSDINLISMDQMRKGFLRLFEEIPEIHIDVPHAYSTLEKFMQSCFDVKLFLSRDVINSVPSRGRKRFISEGDGGRIKE